MERNERGKVERSNSQNKGKMRLERGRVGGWAVRRKRSQDQLMRKRWGDIQSMGYPSYPIRLYSLSSLSGCRTHTHTHTYKHDAPSPIQIESPQFYLKMLFKQFSVDSFSSILKCSVSYQIQDVIGASAIYSEKVTHTHTQTQSWGAMLLSQCCESNKRHTFYFFCLLQDAGSIASICCINKHVRRINQRDTHICCWLCWMHLGIQRHVAKQCV